jgi:peptide/nickel transport system substrate-binding protein
MQNRFGIKDFFLFVLIAAVGLIVVFNMIQQDRAFTRNTETLDRVKGLEGQIGALASQVNSTSTSLGRLEQRVASGIVAPPAPSAANASQAQANASSAPSGSQDAPWARKGVKIDWQPEPEPPTDPRSIAGYQPGGEITELWEAQTKCLTPNISTDVYSRRIQELVLESLGDYDPKTLKMHGILADAWQIDPEGKWLRAHIRANARFSDGTPLTAEDIRYSFHDYLMNEQIEAERSRSIYRDSIEKVEVIDPLTVEFSFKERLFSNVSNALGLSIVPKHIYSTLSPQQINRSTGLLVGSGPFRIKNFNVDKQWAPPEDVVLERNEQYWGTKPAISVLRYRGVNEEIARLNTYFAGQAEIITPTSQQFVSKKDEPEWLNRTQFLNWVNMRSGYSFIAWNCGERNGKLTPFADKRVRRAMTLALDRERMIQDIWKGIGQVAKGNQPLGSPGANDKIKPWPFNRTEALRLLKEAGYEDRNGDGLLEDKLGSPFSFQYTYSAGGEIAERVAKFVKDAYAAIGIKVEPRGVEWAVYTDLLKTRDFDAITLGWGANAPESDPVQIFHSKSIQNQGDNFAQWNNSDADRLIDQGRREMDDDKRAAIWRDFEAVLHEEQPYTFVRVPPWLRFVSKDVGNVVMYPKGLEPAEYFRTGATVPKPAM